MIIPFLYRQTCKIVFYFVPSTLIIFVSLLLFLLEQKYVFLNGNHSCSGIVGIEQGAKTYWLSGSGETWDKQSADTVCQQANCGIARNFSTIPSRRMRKDISNVTYKCYTNTTSLFQCENTGRPSDHRNTLATVTCTGKVTKYHDTHTFAYCRCFISCPILVTTLNRSFFLLWLPSQNASRRI